MIRFGILATKPGVRWALLAATMAMLALAGAAGDAWPCC